MTKRQPDNIDKILAAWPYEPGAVHARRVRCGDGREVIQMRVEMGLLQMEIEGRPDGEHPEGAETYFDYLLGRATHEGEDFELSEEDCDEIDREFVQFYHRRICWLALQDYGRARRDADHTLALMDFSAAHCADESWVLAHEQYRPLVMFHRTKAAALASLDDGGAEGAIDEIDGGLRRLARLYDQYDMSDQFEDDELVSRLNELKQSIRDHYQVDSTLQEELAEAIAVEDYERAARLRDKIRKRQSDDL